MFSIACLLARVVAKGAEKCVTSVNYMRHGIKSVDFISGTHRVQLYAAEQLLGDIGANPLHASVEKAAQRRYNGRQFYQMLIPASIMDVLLLWPTVHRWRIVEKSTM